mgnify:FL=1
MSLSQFVLTLLLFNFLSNLVLLFVSVNKKSSKFFLKFFFVPILLCAWLALTIQQVSEVAYLSTRQVLGNVILSFWVLASTSKNKPLKIALLSDYLNKFKEAVINKQTKRIIWLISYISMIQIVCFSPIISLNFLSGPSSFYFIDLFSSIICIFGLFVLLKSYKEAKSEVRHPLDGFLGHALHPDYLGNLILFLGMFLLSTGSTGGFWSIIGPITMLFLLVKVIIPENKRNITQTPSTLNL